MKKEKETVPDKENGSGKRESGRGKMTKKQTALLCAAGTAMCVAVAAACISGTKIRSENAGSAASGVQDGNDVSGNSSDAASSGSSSFTDGVYGKYESGIPDSWKGTADVGEYKGIGASYTPVTFTDSEYEQTVQYAIKLAKDYTDTSSGTVKQGDIAVVTYKGCLASAAENGKVTKADTALTSTSDTEVTAGPSTGAFPDGFESSLVGAQIGSTVTVKATLSDSLGDSSYAGKEAVYEITVKAVRKYAQTPSAEKVKENLAPVYQEADGTVPFTDFDGFKKWLKDDMTSYYSVVDRQNRENAVLQTLEAQSKNVTSDPDELKEMQKQFAASLESNAATYGMDTEEAAAQYGYSSDDSGSAASKYVVSASEQEMKARTVIKTVARKENITVNDSDIDSFLSYLAAIYRTTPHQVRAQQYTSDAKLAEDALIEKTLKFVTDNAALTETQAASAGQGTSSAAAAVSGTADTAASDTSASD